MFLPTEKDTFSLDNFEGPLEFLLHLVQKKEIDIYDVEIQKITDQYTSRQGMPSKEGLDSGAEFIGTTSSLLLYKSRKLLPDGEGDDAEGDETEEAVDPNFDIIHHLLDYCRFRDAANHLASREEAQSGIYYRGLDTVPNPKLSLGIEHLSLGDLNSVFEQALERAAAQQGSVEEEQWRVSDKIRSLRALIKQHRHVAITDLLSATMSRNEIIVTFLAMLELIKIGSMAIIRDNATGAIFVIEQDDSVNLTTTEDL